MKINDALLLASSKLRARKLRMINSIIAISVLFGVIVAAFLVVHGLRSGLESAADMQLGGKTYLNVSQSISSLDDQRITSLAIELYKASTDLDKEYPLVTTYPSGEELKDLYLDKNNVFALQAADEYRSVIEGELKDNIAGKIDDYGASVLPIKKYIARADSINVGGNHTISNAGGVLLYLPEQVGRYFEQSVAPDNDAISVIVPLDVAGQIVGLGQIPSSASSEEKVEYISLVREKALGYVYEASLLGELVELEVSYKIVELSSPLGSFRLAKRSNEFHILDIIMSNLGADPTPFIVSDNSSLLFQDTYTESNVFSISANYLVEFAEVDQAADFRERYSCGIAENHCQGFYVEEILNNHLNINSVFGSVDWLLIIFAVFFSVVAVIIMMAVLSRIFDEEHQAIALYRAVGAATRDIVQIYAYYVAMLCGLACVAAMIIGIILAGMASMGWSADLVANVGYFYGVSEGISITLIGFDLRILLVFVTIFVVGALCFVLLSNKLTARDIVKDLKG
ncbi:MAG: ABC transporter permease [Candidatus Nomurabacteria bacterium]|jgi:ABC-type lipoprotein release transport system permease subunit|nr:ABC transporter permease [Candidatus Nomurabacteria bacterium]